MNVFGFGNSREGREDLEKYCFKNGIEGWLKNGGVKERYRI